MNRKSMCLILLLALSLLPAMSVAQQTTATGGQGPGRGTVGRGGRGPAGVAAPANVPFRNERTEGRHQTFVEIAQAGDIDLLFVGDSITDWFYMDIGDEFLTADGTLTTEVMGDGLHPTAMGYQIWADAIMPAVQDLMQ